MTDAFAQQSFQAPPTPATVADVMRPPLTTVEKGAHVAAAAYLMKHAGATALMIRDGHHHGGGRCPRGRRWKGREQRPDP
jgi:hypothetical protein